MGDTVGRPEPVRANPEEQESNRTSTTATPAVDSSIAGETTHTVIEPRTHETSETVKPDDRRPEPVQLFPDDSQLPDLGLSGDSNLWQDGFSYRQNDRENNRNSRKGYNGAANVGHEEGAGCIDYTGNCLLYGDGQDGK